MRWFWYSVAVLATVAAVALWSFVLGGGRAQSVPGAQSGAVSQTAPAAPVSVVLSTPAERPMPVACVNGETWAYRAATQNWFKLDPVMPCK